MTKKDEFKVSIPASFVQKNILDEYELAVYVYIKFKLLSSPDFYCVVSADEINFALWGENALTVKRNRLKDAIESLIEKNLLKGVCKNKYYILDPKALESSDEKYFFTVSFKEFITIVRNGDTRYTLEMFFYFCLMISSLNGKHTCEINGVTYKSFCGTLSKKFFLERLAAKESTVSKWDKILAKQKLIYKTATVKDNKTHVCYGRYKDAEKIMKFTGTTSTYRYSSINEKRSLTQKYHRFCEGKDYTIPEIMEIYSHCISHNEKCDKDYIEKGDESALSRKLDLKVFSDFMHVESED